MQYFTVEQAKERANGLNQEAIKGQFHCMVKVIGTTNTAVIIVLDKTGKELGYLGDSHARSV